MRRLAARRDGNEAKIVATLEKAGASVERLNGRGVPDLLVSFAGGMYLLEVKDPSAARGRKQATQLTQDQRQWHERWQAKVWVVTSEIEALKAIRAIP